MSTTPLDADVGDPRETDLDDIAAYVATFDDEERQDLAAAEAAIDIAILLHRARERRGLSQTAAANLAGLHQQAVSRFERPDANPHLETIQAYLGALGYALELSAIDLETGEAAARAVLPPRLLGQSRRAVRPSYGRRHPPRRRGPLPVG